MIDSCHLQEKEDPQKLENLTDDQLFAFLQFQALVPSCRLHGSTVYGLSTPNSDVDICVEDSDLLDSADINWKFGVTLFDVVQDLTNQPLSRVILQHDNGTEIDIVGMRHYHEEKDIVIQRICEVVEFKEFFESVQTWWKRCDHFRSVDGYPNKFNVFLTGIFFLQFYAGVSPWMRLAAADPPQLQCQPNCTASDIFKSFLRFLSSKDACRVKMDLKIGLWQDKRIGGSQSTWLLKDPCTDRNVFDSFNRNLVQDVEEEAYLEHLAHFP